MRHVDVEDTVGGVLGGQQVITQLAQSLLQVAVVFFHSSSRDPAEIGPEERGKDGPVLVSQLRYREDIALKAQQILQEVVGGVAQRTFLHAFDFVDQFRVQLFIVAD